MGLLRVLCFLLFVLTGLSWSEALITPQNFVTHALVAKQIAPGSSRVVDLTIAYGIGDTSYVSDKTKSNANTNEQLSANEKIDAGTLRLNLSLFTLTWPKTKNLAGDYDYGGHTFGGGIFLNAHFSPILEVGFAPTFAQWLGPFYAAASYELSVGKYYGKDADEEMDFNLSTDFMFTGALNVGGGTMMFMNNHGLGFGLHGGLRQIHIVKPNFEKYTDYDRREGKKINPQEQQGFHAQDWLFYYGIDFAGYTNLPLLKETNSKSHMGYVMSIETGVQQEDKPFSYFAFTFGLFL